MKRVLITGGGGFIGSHLAEALLKGGSHVTIIDNLSTGRFDNIAPLTSHPNFRFAIESITNEVVIDRLSSEADIIFHLAAAVGVQLIVRDPVHTIETNIMGTEYVLKAAQRYRLKLMIASTSEVYGKGAAVPFNEEDDVVLGATSRSRWAYAASKMVDEFLGLAYYHQMGLPVTVFRLFNTVGPKQTGQYGMVIPRFVQQALKGEPLTVYDDGKQSRCFCDVEDAVRGIIGLADTPDSVGKVFNIGSTEEVTIHHLANMVLEQINGPDSPKNRVEFIPYDQAYAGGFEDMRHRKPDISRIKQVIGWEPKIPLRDTLSRVIKHFKEKPS
jgi:UDP-glucose 4-epimerase